MREEGFERIVLAGIPMDAKSGHIVRQKTWTAAPAFHNGWRKRKDLISPYVRSMSGWTQELLGKPNPAWLAG